MLIFRDCVARLLERIVTDEGTTERYFFSRVKNEAQATELFRSKKAIPPGGIVRYSGKASTSVFLPPISTLWEIFTPTVASLPQSTEEGVPQS